MDSCYLETEINKAHCSIQGLKMNAMMLAGLTRKLF